jgi:isoleucyl-tRNA synthetase
LGPLGNRAADWIRQQNAADLHERSLAGSFSIELDGASVELKAEDIAYGKAMPTHLILSEEAGNRVILDTTMDDRLKTKGWVRELTHRIQMARKNADFDVTDRIAMTYCADEALKVLVEANREEIAEEILAVSVGEADSPSGEYSEAIEFDEMSITVALTRTATGKATEEE